MHFKISISYLFNQPKYFLHTCWLLFFFLLSQLVYLYILPENLFISITIHKRYIFKMRDNKIRCSFFFGKEIWCALRHINTYKNLTLHSIILIFQYFHVTPFVCHTYAANLHLQMVIIFLQWHFIIIIIIWKKTTNNFQAVLHIINTSYQIWILEIDACFTSVPSHSLFLFSLPKLPRCFYLRYFWPCSTYYWKKYSRFHWFFLGLGGGPRSPPLRSHYDGSTSTLTTAIFPEDWAPPSCPLKKKKKRKLASHGSGGGRRTLRRTVEPRSWPSVCHLLGKEPYHQSFQLPVRTPFFQFNYITRIQCIQYRGIPFRPDCLLLWWERTINSILVMKQRKF